MGEAMKDHIGSWLVQFVWLGWFFMHPLWASTAGIVYQPRSPSIVMELEAIDTQAEQVLDGYKAALDQNQDRKHWIRAARSLVKRYSQALHRLRKDPARGEDYYFSRGHQQLHARVAKIVHLDDYFANPEAAYQRFQQMLESFWTWQLNFPKDISFYRNLDKLKSDIDFFQGFLAMGWDLHPRLNKRSIRNALEIAMDLFVISRRFMTFETHTIESVTLGSFHEEGDLDLVMKVKPGINYESFNLELQDHRFDEIFMSAFRIRDYLLVKSS